MISSTETSSSTQCDYFYKESCKGENDKFIIYHKGKRATLNQYRDFNEFDWKIGFWRFQELNIDPWIVLWLTLPANKVL